MEEITWADLRSLRQKLEQGWDKDTAYELYGGARGSSVGQCYVSALVAYLTFEEFRPRLINGDVGRGDNDHFWLEIDGRILDLTADQFDEFGLPPIVWGTYEEFPNYKPLREDTGIRRFLMLLRRCGMQRLLCRETPDIHHSSPMTIGRPVQSHNRTKRAASCVPRRICTAAPG